MRRESPAKKLVPAARTSWEGVASWYHELLDGDPESYQTKVILHNLLRLLDLKKGETVLDLACGDGFFSQALAAAGAKVWGVDASPRLIAMAKERKIPGATFAVCSADNLLGTADRSMDAAAIVLAIQNIENLAGVFRECARTLRPGGRLAIVMNHPAFRIPKRSSWEFDEKKNILYRRVDGYLGESRAEIEMHPGSTRLEQNQEARSPQAAENKVTISFHRPLQVYFKALVKSGFLVGRLEEWVSQKKSAPGPRQGAENRARNEFPLFLALEARKT